MYTPEAFISAVKTAKSTPEPFIINMMSHKNFLDWKDVCTQMGGNKVFKDNDGNTFKFTDLRVVKIDRELSQVTFFKTSYSEKEFKKHK